ncbi:MAG TPA: hypothetical protein VFD27_19970 [Chthoniobacteraceae bacterium]|jgi:hypothetical protein|nr:hypothetical protein [Chthoniobacteraceae bacterium]
MNLAIAFLAFVGLLLIVLGRRIIIEDARGFSTGWVLAIRCLPLADLMYLARFWDSAKTGAFMSLAGLVLCLPAGGKALWDRKHPKPEAKGATLGLLDADTRNGMFMSMKSEHEERVERKRHKVQALNGRLSTWYDSMESRRAGLAQVAPSELAKFNAEAAAYTAFRAVVKKEADELGKLQAKRYDSYNAISDQEYRDYQERMEKQSRRKKPGVETEEFDFGLGEE